MSKDIHIGFEVNSQLQGIIDARIYEDIIDDDLNVKLIFKPNQVWQSFEWTIPGLIAAYVLKPYFDSFLKEAGKDHYLKLKECFRKLLKISYSTRSASFKASELSPQKLNPSNTQTTSVSIYFQLKDGKRLKLLYDKELTYQDWIDSTNNMLDLVRDHYSEYPNDLLSLKLQELDYDKNNEFYCIINPRSLDWEILDLQKVGEYSMRKK